MSKSKRNEKIIILRRNGHTYEELGQLFNVTPQRVFTICQNDALTEEKAEGCELCGKKNSLQNVFNVTLCRKCYQDINK